MEFAIYGSKDGYRPFTETDGGNAFSREFRANSSNDLTKPTIGQSFYGIGIVDNFRLFTKFKIVKDVDRKATGFLAFTLGIERNKKLSGDKIWLLLNELSSEYRQKYNIENEIKSYSEDEEYNRGLFAKIATRYDSFIEDNEFPNPTNYDLGNEEGAFFYYNSDEEVRELFNDPDWSIFNSFETVLLIDKYLRGKDENPLNAFRHNPSADLTDKIDLKNLRYRLKFDSSTFQGADIQCKINDVPAKSGDSLRLKDQLEIVFKKEFYQDIKPSGSLEQLRGDFLDVDDLSRVATVRRNISVEPIKKTIFFKVEDENTNRISNAEIFIKADGKSEDVVEGHKEFSAEDLGKKWKVSAKKSETEYSEETTFIPFDTNEVSLIVKEHKVVQIIVINPDGHTERNARISIEGKKSINGNNFEFIGKSEINRRWRVSFTLGQKYEDGTEFIEPLQKDTFQVIAKKRKKYLIDAGEHGELKQNGFVFSNDEPNSKEFIKPHKRYRFKRFKRIEEKEGEYDGKLIAQYERKKSPMKLILFVLLGFIFIAGGGIGGYYLMYKKIPFKSYFTTTNSESEDTVDEVSHQEDPAIEKDLPVTSHIDSTATNEAEVNQEEFVETKQESNEEANGEINEEFKKNSNDATSQSPSTTPTPPKIKKDVEASETIKFLQGDFTKQELENYNPDGLSEGEKTSVKLIQSFWNDYFSKPDKTLVDYKEFLKKIESNPILKKSLLKHVVVDISESDAKIANLNQISKNTPIKLSEIKNRVNQ